MKKVKTSGIAERVGRAGAEGVMEGVRARLGPILEEQVGPFWNKLHKELPGTARETVRQAAEEAKDIGSRAIRGVSLPAGLGAGAGALTAPEGERGEGALRGAAGGLAGGLVGAAWGRSLPSIASRALPLGGSALVGAGAGATLRHGNKEKPMKNKYAAFAAFADELQEIINLAS